MKLFDREEFMKELRKARPKIIGAAIFLAVYYLFIFVLQVSDPGHNQRIVDGIKAKQQEAADAAKNRH